jgi:hypothetical protein
LIKKHETNIKSGPDGELFLAALGRLGRDVAVGDLRLVVAQPDVDGASYAGVIVVARHLRPKL